MSRRIGLVLAATVLVAVVAIVWVVTSSEKVNDKVMGPYGDVDGWDLCV